MRGFAQDQAVGLPRPVQRVRGQAFGGLLMYGVQRTGRKPIVFDGGVPQKGVSRLENVKKFFNKVFRFLREYF